MIAVSIKRSVAVVRNPWLESVALSADSPHFISMTEPTVLIVQWLTPLYITAQNRSKASGSVAIPLELRVLRGAEWVIELSIKPSPLREP